MSPAKLMTVALAALVNLAFVVLAGAAQDGSSAGSVEPPGDRLTRATRVTLDFDDAPIAEVVQAIGERSGKRIQVRVSAATSKGMMVVDINRRNSQWGHRVTLKAAEPVRFWEAVDRLCEAGKLGARLTELGETGSATSGLVLEESDRGAGGLVDYAGPFRVALIGLHEHRDALFVQGPWVRVQGSMSTPIDAADLKSAPSDGGVLYAELQVMAEPGLICRRDGPLRDLESTDGQGESLLAASAEERLARSDPHADFIWGTLAPLRIPLKRPDGPDQTIGQLRGAIPVEIAVLRDKPALTISLSGAEGKEFQGAGAVFTVKEFSTDHDGRMTLALTARILDDLCPPRLRASRLWTLRTYQYRVVDPEGKDVQFQTWTSDGDRQGSISLKFTYDYRGNGSTRRAGSPTKILVYDLDRASWSIPFAFQNVPLP